ncbi:lysoplasmalogenase [Chondrinema litorale]|uniref:lysoplasmalogenase n=1 Tax=Chondrinema litorale TaxID=2994555 RepID=UPI002542D4AC|nr:lysoplasmalogenase [Chondrinema litorale]UZR95724.1 lysoplasmalogenase [Chondrinema litorale]
MKNRLFHIAIIIISILVLTAEFLQIDWLMYLAKPCIMLWVISYYLLNTQKNQLEKNTLIAFSFALLGDVLLMFQKQHESFFILGLASFLVCQVSYLQVFMKPVLQKDIRKSILVMQPYFLLFFLIYAGSLFTAMYHQLEHFMRIAVFVYAAALTAMAATALNRKGYVAEKSFSLIFTGSLLFLISDSLIGINKFTFQIPYAGIWILGTYIAAQYLIVRGLIEEKFDK